MKNEVPQSEYDEKYFMWVNDGHQEFRKSFGAELPERLIQTIKLADIKKGLKILDVGCGRGEVLIYASKKGCEAVGIDYSNAAVKLARQAIKKNRAKADVIQSETTTISYPDNYFDRAFLTEVVEHLTPEQLGKTIDEIHRVLKIGGLLVITTSPNKLLAKPLYKFSKLVGVRRGDINKHVHINEQSYFSLKKALKGFSTKFSFKTDTHWFKNTHAYAEHKKFVRPLTNVIDSGAFQCLLKNTPLKIFLATDIICVAKKE